MRKNTLILTITCSALLMLSGCASGTAQRGDPDCDNERRSLACDSVQAARHTDNATDRVTPDAQMAGPLSSTVENSPVVKAAASRIDAADAEISKAQALYYPTMALEASTGLRAGERHPSIANEQVNPYSYALTMRVPLYQGDRARTAVEVARAGKNVAIEGARDIKLSVAYEVALSLVSVEQNKQLLWALTRHERHLRALANEVEAERTAGGASSVDTDDVARQLASLSVNRREAMLALARAEEALLRFSVPAGVNVDTLRNLSSRLPTDADQALAIAIRKNPRLSERFARTGLAKARMEQAGTTYNPSLVLELSAGGDGNAASYRHQDEASAMLKLSVPLLTGGAREAEIRASSSEFSAAGFELDAARAGVRAAVSTAIRQLHEAHAMLSAAKREQTAASKLLKGISAERKLGERSVFDEVRAIADLAQADRNIASSTANLRSAEVTLAAETGLLADYLGISAPVVTAMIKD